jgi:phage tail-like protein
MAGDERREGAPLDTAHFSVSIDGVDTGFAYVGGLASESDPADPRSVRPGTVVLRRAISASRDLFLWRERVARGVDDRRRVVIRQHDAAGTPIHSWSLEGGWPCRWSGPTFDALQGGLAFEEIELAYERLVWLDEEEGHGRST